MAAAHSLPVHDSFQPCVGNVTCDMIRGTVGRRPPALPLLTLYKLVISSQLMEIPHTIVPSGSCGYRTPWPHALVASEPADRYKPQERGREKMSKQRSTDVEEGRTQKLKGDHGAQRGGGAGLYTLPETLPGLASLSLLSSYPEKEKEPPAPSPGSHALFAPQEEAWCWGPRCT